MNIFKKIQTAWDWRKAYVEKNKLEAFRLVNGTGDDLPGLMVDYYGGSFQVVFKDPIWISKKEELLRALREMSRVIDPKREIHFFEVENFSPQVGVPLAAPVHTKKIISEHEFKFETHLGEGLHTGLFLDQRENRKTIFFNSSDRRVLNLFSYTGAFTIAALKGGAKEVVSVDLSKNYLEWLKRNVELNGFDLRQSPVWARDVFDYLKLAQKKNEKFDLIIIDPPTFSRSGKNTFSTEKNLKALVSQALSLLRSQGNMFISVNTLKMDRRDFQLEVEKTLNGSTFQILKSLSVPRDFKLTPEEEKNPYLKACWVGL